MATVRSAIVLLFGTLVTIFSHVSCAATSDGRQRRGPSINPTLVAGVDNAEQDADAAISAAEALSEQASSDVAEVPPAAVVPTLVEDLAAAAVPMPSKLPARPSPVVAAPAAPHVTRQPLATEATVGFAAAAAARASAPSGPEPTVPLASAPSPVHPASPAAAPPGGLLPSDSEAEDIADGMPGAPSPAAAELKDLDDEAEEVEAKVQADAEIKAAEGDMPKDDKKRKEVNPNKAEYIEDLKLAVTKETKSAALAEFLGILKMDIFDVKEKVVELQKDVSDGVELAPEDPSETVVYPVSTAMQCILSLTGLYFVIYTARAVAKVLIEVFELGDDTLLDSALRVATETVFFAPMLCVLFLGAQLRADQISQGHRGPPPAAELGMQACTVSVFVQTLLVLAIPLFSGETATVGEDGIKFPIPENRAVAGLLTIIQGAAMTALYLGVSVVCVVVVVMDARSLNVRPVDLWDNPTTVRIEYAPAVSAAMQCTIGLAQLFFFVYLTHGILNSLVQFRNQAGSFGAENADTMFGFIARWEQCFRACTSAVSLAPMACVLFMTSRLRALEIDPKDGKPQPWAETMFFVCTWAIALQVVIILGCRLLCLDSGRVGVMDAWRSSPRAGTVLDKNDLDDLALVQANTCERWTFGIRVALGFLTVACVAGICVSALTLVGKSPKSSAPYGPTLISVIILCGLYFSVHLGMLLCQATAILMLSTSSSADQSVQSATLQRFVRLFKLAEGTVRFCPMLALLFLGARIRALRLSGYEGSPQCWAQDAMYVSVAALALQLGTVVLSALLSKNIDMDSEGSVTSRNVTYVPGRAFFEVSKVVAFVALYGGVLLVGVSVLVIRPETAGCAARGLTPVYPGST